MNGKLANEETAFERALLDAARFEEPSPEQDRKMLLPLGVAPLALASGGAKVGARASWAKWAALGAVAATGAGAWIAWGANPKSNSPVTVAATVDSRPREATSVEVREPESTASEIGEPSPWEESVVVRAPSPNSKRSGGATKNGDTLKEELALLERARAYLGSGEKERAREVLARYHRRYQNGQLREEARVLDRKATE